MKPTVTEIELLRDTADMLTTARFNMLRYELITEGSSYDKQLKALAGRCRKAAEALNYTLFQRQP